MEAALGLEPTQADWRQEFAEWLIFWGDLQAARAQALVGLQLRPGHQGLLRTLDVTAEQLAQRGRPLAAGSGP
jgi:hypothetical protein